MQDLFLILCILFVIISIICIVVKHKIKTGSTEKSVDTNAEVSREPLSPLEEQTEQFIKDHISFTCSIEDSHEYEMLQCSLPAYGNKGHSSLDDANCCLTWVENEALCLFPDWFFSSDGAKFSSAEEIEKAYQDMKIVLIPFYRIEFFKKLHTNETDEILLCYRQDDKRKNLRFEIAAYNLFIRWFPEKEA